MLAGPPKVGPVDFWGHMGRFPLGLIPTQSLTEPFFHKCQFPTRIVALGVLFLCKIWNQKVEAHFFHAAWLYEVPWCLKGSGNTKMFTPHISVKLLNILHCAVRGQRPTVVKLVYKVV